MSIRDWGLYVLDMKQEEKKQNVEAAEKAVIDRLKADTDDVRSPIASRSHWLTLASTLSTSRPAALRVSICFPTENSAALPCAK